MNKLEQHNINIRNLLGTEKISLDFSILSELVNLDLIDLVLRDCFSIEEMREAGSFFTGAELTNETVKSLVAVKPITFDSVVLDPTCGAGNLLIGCSRMLGVEKTLSETLERWGKVLWGFDIYESFIEATKLRLVIEAIYRGVERDCTLEQAFLLLPNISCRDALLVEANELTSVTHAVMNPPFTIWSSPKTGYWKNGKLNAAGIIFDQYIRILPEKCSLSSILPDVLRSGSRYFEFRDFISTKLTANCKIWGKFSNKTNVDVFILSGVCVNSSLENIAWFEELGEYTRLSDKFDVCTGPLVAYRDLKVGKLYPYFHPKNSLAWTVITKASEVRQFSGKVIMPPFVIVKRTSSPSDKYRASATLINLKEEVAIENHMIVIKPKSRKIKDCRMLMKVLKSNRTNKFLNDRSRMRHLTVQVIKNLPL